MVMLNGILKAASCILAGVLASLLSAVPAY